MTKIVLNGQEFKLTPIRYDAMAEDDSGMAYALKPIEPEEEVNGYWLTLKPYMDKYYDLTPSEAKAVAKCLETVMGCLLGEKDTLHVVSGISETRKLIQTRKGKV